MRLIALILILVFAASAMLGCKNDAPKAETTSAETSATTEITLITEPLEPVTVSPLATEDLLTPLEDFSWEREFAPEYVMLHFTSAVVLSKDDPYNMDTVRKIFTDSGVSINYIVDRDGRIYCYVPEDRAAWHAGKGSIFGDERLTNSMNKYSIGIEMLAIGTFSDMSQYLSGDEYNSIDRSLIGYTDEQYESVRALVADICERNGIPTDRDHIIGHEEYSPTKSDPGELFDWSRIFE